MIVTHSKMFIAVWFIAANNLEKHVVSINRGTVKFLGVPTLLNTKQPSLYWAGAEQDLLGSSPPLMTGHFHLTQDPFSGQSSLFSTLV